VQSTSTLKTGAKPCPPTSSCQADQPIASAHGRRYAPAQALGEDSDRLHPSRPWVYNPPRAAPDTATAEDLRRYPLHLADPGVGRPSVNAAATALRFFCEVTLVHGGLMTMTSHVRAARTLPVILTHLCHFNLPTRPETPFLRHGGTGGPSRIHWLAIRVAV
jgi:hypothetical protein